MFRCYFFRTKIMMKIKKKLNQEDEIKVTEKKEVTRRQAKTEWTGKKSDNDHNRRPVKKATRKSIQTMIKRIYTTTKNWFLHKT